MGCRRPEGRVDHGSKSLEFLEDVEAAGNEVENIGLGRKRCIPRVGAGREAMHGPGKAGVG